ncbi:MAG TPA: hypothetical protein PLB89_14785 [Flavobacteriales bacterium]|nr:hypothetical protein [Flavobacteriales bacterium]
MDLTRTLVTCATLGLSFIAAQAQFQVVHDVPNTTSTPEITPLILSDGNTVTHHWDADQHIFRKYDANGDLLWSKALEGSSMPTWDGEHPIILMNDGADGFHYLYWAGLISTPIDELLMEYSVEYFYQIGHMNGNGALSEAFLLKKSFIGSVTQTSNSLSGFDAARTPDNGMVLITTVNMGAGGTIDMTKLDGNGGVEWSRSVGDQLGVAAGPEPTFHFDNHAKGKLAVSATGRIYWMEGGQFGQNSFRLAELDNTGELLWMKRYVYANIPPSAEFDDIQVDDAGSVHAVGRLTTNVGLFHYFLRTNADGILDRGDLYRTPLVVRKGHLGIDADGRRYHRVYSLLPIVGPESHGMLIADTLGNPARFIRRDDQVVLPNNVFRIPQRIDVSGDRLVISGLLHHEHVDLAFTTRYESLSSFDTDEVFSCLMNDTMLAHIPVPLDIMTTEDVADAASIDISAYYTSEPISLTFADEVLDELDPLCTFSTELLGLNVGLGDGSSVEIEPLVLNSIVALGSPILLNASGVHAVEAYDVHGTLVQRSTLVGSRSLATAGWAPGAYVIRALDKSGALLRIGRVVLE